MRSYKVLSERCGQRWPRLLPLQFAAAYVGMIDLNKFELFCRSNGIGIREFAGELKVDRDELDNFITATR